MFAIWQSFMAVKGQIEKLIDPSGHTATGKPGGCLLQQVRHGIPLLRKNKYLNYIRYSKVMYRWIA